ncbi:MAG: aminotransferase class I/II-fold pyridoxal phosphate-dependent enzyme [Alphaproteobacteria bacterium]|jgi:aspartate/methionine/tyrosine aminotransferase|nr:aminotransferase class I/II-fold pyridoxal phosphate-dependent enzyme [Alphaproteobacteria bacterium]
MEFAPFALEQWLSDWEQTVDYNFSESGVHPVVLKELLEMAGESADNLLDTPLNYPEVNGDTLLRERIAALYEDASPERILVTVGASEANFLLANTLLDPGDELAVMRPTYMQIEGAARNRGVAVREFGLDEARDWALDIDSLNAAVTPNTKVIAVVNPNNPSGKILDEAEMDAIVAAADRVGAWIIADEVYAGAERERNDQAPSFQGRHENVIAVNGLSKAYGLPGLRLGWIVAPAPLIQDLWRRHEFTTISTTMLGNRLGEIALRPAVRSQLIQRTRRLIRDGFSTLEEMLAVHPGVFSVVPPMASALSFVRYDLPIGSSDLVHRLRGEKSVFVIPGDCFGVDHHLRISSALPDDYLRGGLTRVNDLVGDILAGR